MKLVDALDSKSSGLMLMSVRLRPPAPIIKGDSADKAVSLLSFNPPPRVHMCPHPDAADKLSAELLPYIEGHTRLAYKTKERDPAAAHEYVIEYAAGRAENQIIGFLDIHGTQKDFVDISIRYWNTWVVPNCPCRLRVSTQGSDQWSQWLELQAVP